MLSQNKTNFVMDFFVEHGKLRSWSVFKIKYSLNNAFYFQWLQLTDAILKIWKKHLKKC